MSQETRTPTVAIVGAGPAGLTAAAELARRVSGEVLVLDREDMPGGIPRHSDHPGYGLRDLRRNLSGPAYATRLARQATAAGAQILTGATVTHAGSDRSLEVTTVDGRFVVQPRALVLATGARERPRSARLIPGDRPAGVMTTGQLQNEVHIHHREVGTRAVIVGAELVSWSAVLTLKHGGCRTVLMTTRYDRSESYGAFSFVGRHALRVPLATRSELVAISGRERVESVTLRDTDTGELLRVECDTVILTGDWIPDNELARMAELRIDRGTRGPAVDLALRTSGAGIFAAGNVLHPVDTAGVAALDGRHVAGSVARWLERTEPLGAWVPIVAAPPLRWVAPSRLSVDDGEPARNRLVAWTNQRIVSPKVVVRQGGQVIATRRVPWPAVPGRAFRVPAGVLDAVDRDGGEVTIGLQQAPTTTE